MNNHLLISSFSTERDIKGAAEAIRQRGLQIRDAYTPYAVHGLDRAMGLPASRLPWACFAFGLFGAAFALWFQFWTMTRNWPMNVGGKPWNSLPAYVPVTFEMMVLLAGLGVVLAFFIRCGLFPGKHAALLQRQITDDQFVLVIETADAGGSDVARQVCQEFHAMRTDEGTLEE